jgi:AraC-like DNA-binding protein
MMVSTAAAGVPTQRFSTAAFEPHERVAAWRELYGRSMAKLDFELAPEETFAVDATLRTLPELGLASLSTLGLRFTKPRNLIDSDDLILVIMENGGYSGRQLGREVHLGAGDAVIRMNGEVTNGVIFGRSSIVRVPMRTIAPVGGDIGAFVQRRIPADTETLCLLRHYLRAMQDCEGGEEVERLAARHVHDLVALLLGATPDATQVAEGRGVRAARLEAIKQDVARNLEHGDLSVCAVAARHRVTVRYVQKLFEREGTTLSEYVLGLRLACAHQLLSDPRRGAEKIASVAFAAGFGDVSYFYRAFRRQYGVPPTDVRAGTGAKH